MLGGASELDLLVRVLGDAKDLDKSLDGAARSVGGFGDTAAGLAGSLLPAAAAAGAVAVAIGAMTDAAAQDAAEQARLEGAVKAAGAATGDYAQQLDDAIAAGQAKAFSDTQTREAMMSLVTATGDVTAATDLLTTAQDVARFANVDLAVAADAVAKAQAGQDTQLAKLLPGMEKGATAADTLAAATALAAGQADIYASSAEGMKDKGKDAFGEIGETIGAAFLPVLEALMPVILALLEALAQLITAVLPILTPLLRTLAAVIVPIGSALATVVGWLAKLIDKLYAAIGAVGDFLAKINPLQNIHLPSLPFAATAMPRAVELAGGYGREGAASYGIAYGGAGITINVQTTGDSLEAAQTFARTLRRVQRLNAGLVLPSAGRTA